MDVLTLGTFDLLHSGHVHLLEKCRSLAGDGDVIVALNTDEFVEQFKGKRPLMPLSERKALLWAFSVVDLVVNNTSGQDAKPTILKYLPKGGALVIGSDWHGDKYLEQLQVSWEWLRKNNIVLVYVPTKEKEVNSSSLIKARLNVDLS